MGIWLKIASESVIIAIKELWASKLRSFLSLFGITIGILCLISIFSAVDSLEKNLRQSVESLGGDIIYVGKWPWIMSEDYPWWKFIKRPVVSKKDFDRLQGNVKSADALALWRWVNRGTIKHKSAYLEDISLFAVTKNYDMVKSLEFEYGRYLNDFEFQMADNKTFIGNAVAEALFENPADAVGKEITFNGKILGVVGVLKKEGQDILGINAGFGLDNTIYTNEKFAAANISSPRGSDPYIMVKVKDNIPIPELEAELAGRMRIARKLNPQQDNNFALNKISVFTKIFDQLFQIVYLVGIIIGLFSIIVGAFGIANIMFVSVRERTSIIGVKKALGAKKAYILLEFIIEAILLCLLGGCIGLILVYGIFELLETVLMKNDVDFQLIISQKNIILGLSISITTGLIAGIIPAIQAANMKPVDAIRS